MIVDMASIPIRVLITGANGFIGKNLSVRLSELPGFLVSVFLRDMDPSQLSALISEVDVVVHLAGENRPEDESAFARVNASLTQELCGAIRLEVARTGRKPFLILASSIQAIRDTPYGISKLAAENFVRRLSSEVGSPAMIFRLPNVFGKWCKPNYNSVVATYCYNISRGLSIQISDPESNLKLVYVDDVVNAFIAAINAPASGLIQGVVAPEYVTTLASLASQINLFKTSRTSLVTERVGNGFARALYATYISYLPENNFTYEIPRYSDRRGVFVEMLKTIDSGQFSYFTAHPGITRGGHYHHTKTEKFLVIRGDALFRFRHLFSNKVVELRTSGQKPQVVDTIPGWAHDITNIGNDEMLVMLWANEVFDRDCPDTTESKV
jgi:UDP-2-acetamido-2,6-beta-L-arabino-hexul-4-ose reductase